MVLFDLSTLKQSLIIEKYMLMLFPSLHKFQQDPRGHPLKQSSPFLSGFEVANFELGPCRRNPGQGQPGRMGHQAIV